MGYSITIDNGHKTKATEQDCFENLANAIILQAVKDYDSSPEEVENFFRSEWFGVLTKVSPDYIIKLCRQGYGKKIKGDGL